MITRWDDKFIKNPCNDEVTCKLRGPIEAWSRLSDHLTLNEALQFFIICCLMRFFGVCATCEAYFPGTVKPFFLFLWRKHWVFGQVLSSHITDWAAQSQGCGFETPTIPKQAFSESNHFSVLGWALQTVKFFYCLVHWKYLPSRNDPPVCSSHCFMKQELFIEPTQEETSAEDKVISLFHCISSCCVIWLEHCCFIQISLPVCSELWTKTALVSFVLCLFRLDSVVHYLVCS